MGTIQSRLRGFQRQPVKLANKDLSSTDKAFFAILLIYICISIAIRSGGGSVLIGFVVIECMYVLATNSIRWSLPLVLFTGIGVIYVALSYADALPNAWTKFYYSDLIAQQASFVFVLFPSVLAARRLWSVLSTSAHFRVYLLAVAIAGSGVSPLLTLSFTDIDNPFYAVHTPIAFFGISLIILGTRAAPPIRVAIMMTIAVIAALAGESVQIKIIGVAVAGIVLSPWPRAVAVSVCIALVAGAVVGQWLLWYLWDLYPDFGIRIVFIQDAVEAIIDTYGIGIGFGKEAIKNFYPFLDHTHWNLDESFDSFLMTMVHNSFVGVTLRTGVIGGLTFAWIVIVTMRPRSHVQGADRRLAWACYMTAFVNLFSNVGIESPVFSIGVCYLLGFCMYLNDESEVRSERAAGRQTTGYRAISRQERSPAPSFSAD